LASYRPVSGYCPERCAWWRNWTATEGDMEDCIFCKIISGDIDSRVIYRDDNVVGIVDIRPRFARGQCVVMHRRHVPQFYELEDGEIAELFRGVKAVAEKLAKTYDTPVISLFSRCTNVPIHAHIIMYPSGLGGPLEKLMGGLLAAEQLVGITPADLDETADAIRRH
jgi:diadenosine tetraphosphate (Ap4A) HIT family hydrolase